MMYLTHLYGACLPLMGRTLCNCIFLGINALRHSTRSSASSFLMLRSLRSFVIRSLQWSCGQRIYSSWPSFCIHSLEVAKPANLNPRHRISSGTLIIPSFSWSTRVLICFSSWSLQIQQTIPLSADVKRRIISLDVGHVLQLQEAVSDTGAEDVTPISWQNITIGNDWQ